MHNVTWPVIIFKLAMAAGLMYLGIKVMTPKEDPKS